MNIIIKIGLLKIKLCFSFNKQATQVLNQKQNNTEDTNTILSRNLKNLDFINRLESGLNRKQIQNSILIQELNAIKTEAQINTLSCLHKKYSINN